MNTADRTTTRTDSHSIAARRPGSPRIGARPRPARLAQAGALVALSLASAACSVVGATPAAATSVTATRAAATDAPMCRATSEAKVLARRVFVPGGVEVATQDGSISVRFASDPSHCAAVDWPSGAQRAQSGTCRASAATAARASRADEAMLAWESRDAADPHGAQSVDADDAPRALLGFGLARDRRVDDRPLQWPSASAAGGETARQLAPIGDDRFLLAWVDGDSESHQLRARPVAGRGDALGASFVLSPAQASVIGRPSVVVEPTGYGIVTYLASIEGEFDVLATPIVCTTR
jgi:hypothetical protein